jgi:WhiB family redox-sensing transcriptional regulator
MRQPTAVLVPADRGHWRSQAACRGASLEEFFDEGAQHNLGLRYCRRCPVRVICLWEALSEELEAGYAYGIRGGCSAPERAAMANRLGPSAVRKQLARVGDSHGSGPGRAA